MQVQEYSYQTRELAPGVTLHLHPSSKRKTNELSVSWVGNLDESVTRRALLGSVLHRGTRSFPDMGALTRQQESLYGMQASSDVAKIGERHVVSTRAAFVNDAYLPVGEEILGDALSLVRELVADPNLEDGRFPGAVVKGEKENHRRYIESLFNDKRSYARERCIQEMCKDEPFRRYEYGAVEDVDSITSDGLVGEWQSMLRGEETHIYVSGNLDIDAVAPRFAVYAEGRGEPVPLAPLPAVRRPGEVRELEEELDVQQAVLVLGLRTRTRFGDPGCEAMALANGVLGQFPHSKLFVNVREKESLCYTIGSSLDRSQGLMLIAAGIDPVNREKTQELTLKELEAVKAGDFSDEEFDAVLRSFENNLLMIEDNPRALSGIDLTWRVSGGSYDHAEYVKKILSVTRDQVVEAANLIELDTVFVLSPGKES